MDIKNKKKRSRTRGSVTLEASIALTMFIFLMLFLYSFFVVFEARNTIAHTMLTTADSLALDAFANDSVEDSSVQGLLYKLYGKFADSNGTYIETSKWYNEEEIEETVKTRFLSYLSGGDKTEADRILEELNIEGGFDGLDFSNCKIEDNDIHLEVSYTLEYEFQVFGLGSLDFSHSCSSKLWN